MQQTSQAHNRGKNMRTMGKVDTSDLMVILTWAIDIYFQSQRLKWASWTYTTPYIVTIIKHTLFFNLCNVANRRNFPSEKVEKNNCCMLEVKCKVNEISLRFFSPNAANRETAGQRQTDRHTDRQTDKNNQQRRIHKPRRSARVTLMVTLV